MKLKQIKKWRNLSHRQIGFSFILILLVGCTMIREKKMLKDAVNKGVPKTSFWSGGKDGGEWVNILFFKDSMFEINTYNDYTYKLNNSYKYKLTCSNILEKDITQSFDFTNGLDVIWKKNSKVENCIVLISKKH